MLTQNNLNQFYVKCLKNNCKFWLEYNKTFMIGTNDTPTIKEYLFPAKQIFKNMIVSMAETIWVQCAFS